MAQINGGGGQASRRVYPAGPTGSAGASICEAPNSRFQIPSSKLHGTDDPQISQITRISVLAVGNTLNHFFFHKVGEASLNEQWPMNNEQKTGIAKGIDP